MSAVNDGHLAMKALENAIFLLQCSPIPRSRHWEASGARQALGRFIRRALLHLERLGDTAPRRRRR